jgi:SPP1 gp7 family putative phage head morphogenesis protein
VKSVRDALQDAFVAGAEAAMFQLPSKISVEMSFNLMNPKTVEFLNNYSFNLIRQVSQDTRDAVKQVVTRAFQEGGHPFQQAREIKQFIGLTTTQEQAVTNYRNALTSGGASDLKDALSRALRDGRYDKTLLRAISNQTAIPADRVDAMVQRYRERFLQYRARNVARTESARASVKGQRALWKQAVDQDLLPDDVRRVWIISGDSDTCPECEELEGETAGLDEEFAPGVMEPPDPHPSCRCTVAISPESLKKAA